MQEGEEFPMFKVPKLKQNMNTQEVIIVYSEATIWLALANLYLLKREKEILQTKILLMNAKKEGTEEDVFNVKSNLLQLMIRQTDLKRIVGKVEFFTTFIDDNMPDVVGESIRQRVEKHLEMFPFYYNNLPIDEEKLLLKNALF
jgi:hypothetical protein